MFAGFFNDNKIYVVDEDGRRRRKFFIRGLFIRFKGRNAVIELHSPPPKFRRSTIVCGDDAHISFGPSVYKVKRMKAMLKASGATLTIGGDFSATNGVLFLIHKEDDLTIKVGDDCMFGSNVVLRSSDVHTITDKDSGEIINAGQGITIGDHCWLGMNVTLLKGAEIPLHCVVGTGSLVTGKFSKPNAIIAGVPARVIKENIEWSRESIGDYLRSKELSERFELDTISLEDESLAAARTKVDI